MRLPDQKAGKKREQEAGNAREHDVFLAGLNDIEVADAGAEVAVA